jgi:hypothetical protein
MDILFINHFNTQLVILFNYSAVADFHTLPVTPTRAKCSPARSVFNNSRPVTASNNGYSSASVLKPFLNGGFLPTTNSCFHYPPYNCSART